MKQKIVIVDDHGLVRAGLRPILKDALNSECEILEADSLQATLDILEAHADTIDLVLLDLTLPDAQGLGALEKIRALYTTLPISVLSAQTDMQLIQNAYRMNVSGFIIKNAKAEILVSAVRLILSGGVYIPPEMLSTAMSPPEKGRRNKERGASGDDSQLTPRQQEVLYLITKGASNQEISDSVGATIGTVKSHVVGILRALGVHSRTQAISLVHDNPSLLGQYRQNVL
jgi:DNA-binding NarL/FixJ family response regulator